MPELIIDDRKILVPAGTKVIQAAEKMGIMIPRFCYHEALGPLGACRMCAVMFKEGPVKGIEMSCMIDVEDGMVVSTNHPEAMAFRAWIIECLMQNHPHDCPVCDEGGHCLLQDQTVSGGHGIRRYPGKKRTYHDQDLGPFIQHEMNRCIHCWRCRRFYQEFAGYRDLGAMQIASHTYFGRFKSGALESPFSGNLIDICPTGVYTDKPARFKGRRWNFVRGPSVCIHCSLGCSTTGSVRYREIVRQESRQDREVNGYFICDRGRFGFDFVNHPERIRIPRVGNKEVDWEMAMNSVSSKLKEIADKKSPGSVLILGSARCSLETQDMIRRAGSLLKWHDSRFFINRSEEEKSLRAVKGLDKNTAISLSGIEESDFILCLGVDPVNEAPMLALAIRQAWRKNAQIVVADPRPVNLPFDFCRFSMKASGIDAFAGWLVGSALRKKYKEKPEGNLDEFYKSLPGKFESDREKEIMELSFKLGASKRPVIICGTDITDENSVSLAADLTRLLIEYIPGARLFNVMPGPNAYGAALMSPEKRDQSVIESIESGKVKALVLVEQDPFVNYPDSTRLEKALEKLEYLVVMDYLPSISVKKADAVFPTTTLFEKSPVTMLNQEGRIRRVLPLHQGGIPVSQLYRGNHPARTFSEYIPGADPRPAHELIMDLYSAVSGNERDQLLEEIMENPDISKSGERILYRGKETRTFISNPVQKPPEEEKIILYPAEAAFGTEELSGYSRFAIKAEEKPCFMMHHDDAERLGLAQGDVVTVDMEGRSLSMELKLSSSMTPGVVIFPRHRRVPWQIFEETPARIDVKHIHKQ